jgi:hypothetical protein
MEQPFPFLPWGRLPGDKQPGNGGPKVAALRGVWPGPPRLTVSCPEQA